MVSGIFELETSKEDIEKFYSTNPVCIELRKLVKCSGMCHLSILRIMSRDWRNFYQTKKKEAK